MMCLCPTAGKQDWVAQELLSPLESSLPTGQELCLPPQARF